MRLNRLMLLLIVIAVMFMVSVDSASAGKTTKDESLRKGETRATVDPSVYKDARVKKAYQVAKEIPWVLDSIYCYCFCEESPVFKHKSLLSCYVDNHAAI